MTPINCEKIILASGSPRRHELLTQAGICFETLVADIDEASVPYKNDPGAYVQILSGQKAEHSACQDPEAWTLGADTIVMADNTILGKPCDHDHAVSMLTSLSGRAHSVFTGMTLVCPAKSMARSLTVDTRVWFKSLSQKEIFWYASTDEPYDKAGGYGIQGIGAFMVQKIQGSYSNVVGLPVCELIEILTELQVIQF
ncbi:MAG: septum formation inhibitor Maf [Desulfobacter sp.]|nr:MAG: septum formation inhibitor Maf [Desulfobacter sp.]